MRLNPLEDRLPVCRDAARAVPGPGASVLVVDADAATRSFVQRSLAGRFALVETAADAESGDALWQRCRFDLLICDLDLPAGSALAWARGLRRRGSGAEMIFTSGVAERDEAIAVLRTGAADLILKPFRIELLLDAVDRCLERRGFGSDLARIPAEPDPPAVQAVEGMVGSCPAMQALYEVIERVAPTRTTVLIEGETGTGKELAARAIHERSGRRGGFVAISCGAVSPELLESELFGHVKGAFTGAHQAREGLFRYAEGGTLFLDEIGEMPVRLQAKLLRVLEERRVRPVGANQETEVDVRVVAATHRNLAAEVQAGRFREDLFYRLNVMAVRIPPLRERLDDIPQLTHHFLERLVAETGFQPVPCGPTELERLRQYHWPGNVRELRNVIERCLLLRHPSSHCITEGGKGDAEAPGVPDLRLESVERRHICYVLEGAAGNKSAAARRLGISRKTLERKLRTWAAEDL